MANAAYVFGPPAGGGATLVAIYANATGGVVSIPWSADVKAATLGGWETSNGGHTASAGYSFTDFDAVINNQLSYGAQKIVVVLEPIDFGGSNKSTPLYVFSSAWATSLTATQLYTAAASDYLGSGAISPPGSAQGVDNTAFPAGWMTAFQTAWINAVTAALNHMKAASYASKIAYVRVGGGAGGEWFPWGTAGLLTVPGIGSLSALLTAWTGYMSAAESAIVALSTGFTFCQALDGGFATESVPYSWADAEAAIGAGNGFGIGCEGLKGADISNYTAHGTTSGGSATSGFPSMDHAYLFNLYSSNPLLQFQTSAASDPSGVSAPGSLVPLIPYALARGGTSFELYYADWQVAYDASNANYAAYGAAYRAAISSIEVQTPPAMLTYPLYPPAVLGPQDCSLTMLNAIAETISPFTMGQQEQQWPGQMFLLELTLPPMPRSQAEPWLAFLGGLFGKFGTFLMGDYNALSPQGSVPGSPVVNGSNPNGLNVLNTRGWTASQSGILLAGDYIQVTASGSGMPQRIYKNLATANSDGSGDATLQIFPNIRESLVDGISIVTANCAGTFRLQDNATAWKEDRNKLYTISFKAREAI